MAEDVADQQLDFAARAGRWLGYLLVVSLGLLALALTSGSLGNLSRPLYGVLAVACLIGLALAWPRRRQPLSPWVLVGVLVLMAASLLMVARGGPLGILGAGIFFFALSLLPLRDNAPATALLLTSLLFALVRLLIVYWPAAWHFEQWLAGIVSWFVGVGLILGPTALGSSLLILFSLFALSVFLLSWVRRAAPGDPVLASQPPARGRKAIVFLAWVAGLLLAMVAYIWLQPPLGSLILTNWPEPLAPSPEPQLPTTLTYLDSQILLFVLLWVVTALASLGLRPRSLPLAPARSGRGWLIAGLALLALGTTVLTLEAPLRPRRGAILFYDTGHLDWSVPTFGQYGPHSGGDFGLWPAYLEAYGYEARFGPLTADNLAGTQAVVTINMPANLDADEKQRLLAYVEEGGGLVIWGEHTGVHGIREPINDLLAEVPIRLLFDSAVPIRLGWAEGLTFLPHASTYGVQNPIDLVLAVGASLEIAPPARPFIVGQYGHSDAGDVDNRARNYVGDMRYNSGERLGDVVLAAWAPYGQGRITVVGDTTPLGSVNLMTSMPFHARLLDWVTAGSPGGAASLLGSAWLAGLLLILAGICLVMGRSRTALAGAMLVLALVLALTTCANTAGSAPQIPSGPIAYVDAGHQERFDRMLWQDSSIGGLNYNMVRNGALPLLLHNLDTETLAGAELLITIAPGDHFSTREIKTISQWVEAGGRLVVSTGWEESQASRDLLAEFGLAVDHIPLGPAEVERETGLVRFHEAWPVTATYSNAETIVEGYGYPLIIHQPWGQGNVVLIGDSQFLLGSTLEAEASYEVGNINLLRDIMSVYLGFDDPAALTAGGGS